VWEWVFDGRGRCGGGRWADAQMSLVVGRRFSIQCG
jgi:hypothetical protein